MLTAYIQYLGWLWWVRKLSFCFPFVNISWQHFMLRTGMLVPWTNVQEIMCFGLVSQSTSLEPVINALIATTLYSQAQWRPQRIFTNLNIHLKNIWLHIHGHKLPGIFIDILIGPLFLKKMGRRQTSYTALGISSPHLMPQKNSPPMGDPNIPQGSPEFLSSWGLHHGLVSVGNPRANSRAEIAVKTIKRMLMANIC